MLIFESDRGMKIQGLDRTKLSYHSRLQPWLSLWGMFWTALFILINGFAVFWKFNASDFLTSCELHSGHPPSSVFPDNVLVDINIPLFFALYFGWKIAKRTSIWKPSEMDFVSGIPSVEETELPEEPPRTILEKIAAKVF